MFDNAYFKRQLCKTSYVRTVQLVSHQALTISFWHCQLKELLYISKGFSKLLLVGQQSHQWAHDQFTCICICNFSPSFLSFIPVKVNTPPKSYLNCFLIYYYRYSALGPVWAETRAQSVDWHSSGTLHPGQVLRDSLPLLSPAFRRSHFRHQVSQRRERS